MNLSKNFTLQEMTASSTANKHGIANVPGAQEAMNLYKLCNEVLQPIRDKYGKPIIVGSGFRNKQVNKLVGGAANSDHMFGAAADIHTKSDKPADNKVLFDLIVKMAQNGEIECRQIIDEYNYSWIHCAVNHDKNPYKKNQILHIK